MDDAQRITLLEERYVHLQRHVAEQDKAMLELADELARLKMELQLVRAQQAATPGAGDENAADERPPHY